MQVIPNLNNHPPTLQIPNQAKTSLACSLFLLLHNLSFMSCTRNSHMPFTIVPFMHEITRTSPSHPIQKNQQRNTILTSKEKERFWQPITGGIEKGETKTQALKREIQEETGIKNPAKIIKNVHYCEFWDYYKPENRQRLIKEHIFGVEIHPNEKITISHEHTEHKWCTFQQALKLLKWKENKEALKKLNKILSVQK